MNTKYITFKCNNVYYAIDMNYVKGVHAASKITYLPNSPAFLCGLYNLRGNIISVINLAYLVNESNESKWYKGDNILALSYQDKLISLYINDIHKIFSSDNDSLETLDTINKYYQKTVYFEERNYFVLDVMMFYQLVSFKANLKNTRLSDDLENIEEHSLSIIDKNSLSSTNSTISLIKNTQREVADLLRQNERDK